MVYAPLAKKQETFYTAIVNRTIRNLLGNNEVSVDLGMCLPVYSW